MYQYSLYLFKAPYAEYFYFKIDTIYYFLKELRKTNGLTEVNNPFKTVVHSINVLDIVFHLRYYLNDLHVDVYNNVITVKDKENDLSIYVHEYSLEIYADSLVSADRLFFQHIKSYYPHIFVANFENNDCGWITPLAKKELYRL